MIWRFTLIDNDAIETEIDEPVGWDALSMVLQRDNDWHGILPQFSASNLQFADIAYWILKDEYERAGIDGNIGIRIEWKCDDCRKFKLFYAGKIDFNRYEENCAEDCYIIAGIEDDSPLTELKNRQETDVDLTSNMAYDGETVLTDYDGLNKEVEIPSKALHLKGEATLHNAGDDTDAYNLLADFDFNFFGEGTFKYVIIPKLNQTNISEILNFLPSYAFDLLAFSGSEPANELNGAEILDIQPSSLGVSNTYDISYRQKGSVYIKYNSSPDFPSITAVTIHLKLGAKKGTNSSKIDAFSPFEIGSYVGSSVGNVPEEGTINYDQAGTFSVDLADGEKLWFYLLMEFSVVIDPDFIPYIDFDITGDEVSFFNAEVKSYAAPSNSKIFMIHEAASRIVENITDNALKFKSEYYGRTDSEPYSYEADGCGSLRAILNGLQLRNATLNDSSAPKIFTNFKNLLTTINAEDCIGFGVEGSDVRTEPVRYFYKDQVVFVADGVNAYKKKPRTDRIWNQFSCGYEKFETESTNGLDAIHTKRQYRIPIINTDAILERLSKYILDAYAIEVTRRKFGTTEDWRYDQDIFMLCLKRSDTDVEVEQGNITDAENLFDPPTVLNYRLSPIRNALRWFHWVMQGKPHIDADTTKMLFNSGVGNYVAKGLLTDGCVEEAAAIAENDPLFQNQFETIEHSKPFIKPEEVTWNFPLGLNEFLFLKDNIYGKIQYRRSENEDWQFGWITKLEPRHEEGAALFTLVTALEGTPVLPGDYNYIITETGLVITREDGTGLITEN